MHKKGQAAMEFLMTYGWAILVVLAAIAALAYFGVLNPDRFLPEKCTLPSGIACLDSVGAADSITLRIQNAAGFDMQDVNITLLDSTGTTERSQCNTSNNMTINITNSNQFTFGCPGTFSGKENIKVRVAYTNKDTQLDHTKQGDLILKIE